jgi:16S rRNA (guanine527-N7)-methyltransferase
MSVYKGRSSSIAARGEGGLDAGLRALGLDGAIGVPLRQYLDELQKWNRAYNLTAIRDRDEMVTRHLLDSLSVLPVIEASPDIDPRRLLDVGAGAGLPGIPLAIARPGWHIDVLDSNGKKARFMRHVVRALGLDNVQVIEARAEAYLPELPYTAIISRAYAALGDFVASTAHALSADGHWLAMKGKLSPPELEQRPDGVGIMDIKPLNVPGLDEARHLVIARRASPT